MHTVSMPSDGCWGPPEKELAPDGGLALERLRRARLAAAEACSVSWAKVVSESLAVEAAVDVFTVAEGNRNGSWPMLRAPESKSPLKPARVWASPGQSVGLAGGYSPVQYADPAPPAAAPCADQVEYPSRCEAQILSPEGTVKDSQPERSSS